MFEPFHCPGKHAGTQKLFPLARMAEKLGNVPIHLKTCFVTSDNEVYRIYPAIRRVFVPQE